LSHELVMTKIKSIVSIEYILVRINQIFIYLETSC